jgi:hypothetical protein
MNLFVEQRVLEGDAGLLREQGYSAQEVDAVLALQPQQLGDVAKRLAAVRAFAALPEAPVRLNTLFTLVNFTSSALVCNGQLSFASSGINVSSPSSVTPLNLYVSRSSGFFTPGAAGRR